jgi:hypothetical protein
MCDENAAECIGEVDSAEDIRQIREERMSSFAAGTIEIGGAHL